MTILATLLLLLAQPSAALPDESEPPRESPFDIPDPLFPPSEDVDLIICSATPKVEKLEGPRIQYTPEALAARVQGTMLVKCVITREGRVRNCRVLKGLEHLNEATVRALEASRYKPVELRGEPIEVGYTFTLRFTLPESATGTGPRQKRKNAVK